jgi:hypothetical protein
MGGLVSDMKGSIVRLERIATLSDQDRLRGGINKWLTRFEHQLERSFGDRTAAIELCERYALIWTRWPHYGLFVMDGERKQIHPINAAPTVAKLNVCRRAADLVYLLDDDDLFISFLGDDEDADDS